MNVVFNKLEKFSGNADLNTWLKNFERCCVVTNKTDDLVKGQLLMLFVDGQAKAVLEELEEVKEAPQKFSDSVTKLKEVFHTVAAREAKMADFEVRTQRIAESEDEFMLVLVKLFRSANPAADSPTLDVAVKRKFLQGISPSLRRGIFVFCNDPYAAAVSREQLLQHCRKVRVHLVPSSEEDRPETFTPPTVNRVRYKDFVTVGFFSSRNPQPPSPSLSFPFPPTPSLSLPTFLPPIATLPKAMVGVPGNFFD